MQYLLMLWEAELDDRLEDVALSIQGKRASAIYAQTVNYLEPLLQRLRTQQLDSDMIVLLTQVFMPASNVLTACRVMGTRYTLVFTFTDYQAAH